MVKFLREGYYLEVSHGPILMFRTQQYQDMLTVKSVRTLLRGHFRTEEGFKVTTHKVDVTSRSMEIV